MEHPTNEGPLAVDYLPAVCLAGWSTPSQHTHGALLNGIGHPAPHVQRGAPWGHWTGKGDPPNDQRGTNAERGVLGDPCH